MKSVLWFFILNFIGYSTVQYQLTQSFYCGCPYGNYGIWEASRTFRRISSTVRSFDDICRRRKHYFSVNDQITFFRYTSRKCWRLPVVHVLFLKKNICNVIWSVYFENIRTQIFNSIFRQFVFAIFRRLGPFRSNTFTEDTAYIPPLSTVFFIGSA